MNNEELIKENILLKEELEKNKYFVLGFACLLQIVVGWIIYLIKK